MLVSTGRVFVSGLFCFPGRYEMRYRRRTWRRLYSSYKCKRRDLGAVCDGVRDGSLGKRAGAAVSEECAASRQRRFRQERPPRSSRDMGQALVCVLEKYSIVRRLRNFISSILQGDISDHEKVCDRSAVRKRCELVPAGGRPAEVGEEMETALSFFFSLSFSKRGTS